jgi:hypothetical protein
VEQLAHHIPQPARRTGTLDRSALPIAGDEPDAKARATQLIDRLAFEPVDAGTLAESWRFEPEAGACTRIYLADPGVPIEAHPRNPSAPVPAAKLRAALEASSREEAEHCDTGCG